ncbi:MAG: ATP-grasp domain-containing protein [Methylococcales bacterium]|jgi:hypothetical protein|nr:ATP-grasp domain-containing protein [Methylococcales bacterium]MBT7408520.1 ATP-grasp domain-containing protein [Methylococcales bacterium]
MSKTTIALFANKNSSQLNAIRDAVLEQNAEPIMFNIQLEGEDQPHVVMNGNKIKWNDVDFKNINAIHVRCTALNTLPALPPMLNARSYTDFRSQYLREQELQATTYCFFSRLKALNKLVINPLTTAYIEHDTKAQLYDKLRANGFDAPVTMSTNSPELLKNFLKKYPDVVIKPAIGVGSTRDITDYDFTHMDDLHTCPAMVQERIFGDTIRVHIVGDKVVLALKIISDDTVDSRTNTREFEYYKLPDEEEERIVKANRLLGLHFAAWDIIVSKTNNRYVYLDCNPGPYIMWTGPENRMYVFRQLANYMITYSQTQSIKQASDAIIAWKPH